MNEALTNVWRIVENDCVDEIPIMPGLLLDDIKDWMKETEYKEARLYQRTNWKNARLGVFGDMAVAQISMDDEDLVWNVRMEKADKRENKTNIVIPEDASTGENPLDSTNTTEQYFFWENGDGTCSELYLVYFEDTKNLYTIYTNEMVFTRNGDSWDCNSQRSPTVILKPIKADGNDYYDHPFENEIAAARGKNDIRYFRIKMFDDVRTYQYRFGDTVQQWVNSKYNTDGWHIVYDQGTPYAVSADNMFRLRADKYAWREMSANLNRGVDYTEQN